MNRNNIRIRYTYLNCADAVGTITKFAINKYSTSIRNEKYKDLINGDSNK